MKKCVRVVSMLLALMSVPFTPVALGQQPTGLAGLTIAPLMFRNQVGSGSKVDLQVTVRNLQQDILTVAADVVPVTFDDWTYSPKFGATSDHDCSGWFTPTQINQSISATSEGTLNFGVKVPHVKPGVYWCMARVTPHFQHDLSTVSAQYQIPIILFLGIQPKPNLVLGTPDLVAVNNATEIHIPFENTGEGFTVIGASVELRNAATGRVVGTYFDFDRNFYPGTKRNLIFASGELGEGQYIITSKPQAGTRSFSPITRRFNVTKSGITPATNSETYALSPVTFDPGGVRIQMPAGGERSAVLHVVNNSSKPLNVKVDIRGLDQNQDGGFELTEGPPTGKFAVTCDPDTVQIDPGRVAAVRLAISSSKDATGDLWFGIAANAQESHEISEEIYGTVVLPGGNPKLELAETELKKIGEYPYALRFQVKNTGNMSLKPIPFAQVLEQGLTPIANLQVPVLGGGGILPGSVLRNEILLPPNMKPGAYSVSVKYQYGQDLFANLTVPIMVPGAKPKPKGGG